MSEFIAAERDLALCEVCGQLGDIAENHFCTRCNSQLYLRKPGSLQRTWAFLIAAYALYLPANLLPFMETRSLFGVQYDTIMSGVVFLWNTGSWVLALIVFFASIAIPLLKLLSLTALLVSVQRRSKGSAQPRARLYRLLELIGRWSMLDIYVVAILVALVQAQSLASMAPGPGVLAFAAVVVLSMLATMSFDPRMIWDTSALAENEGTCRESNRAATNV